MDRVFATRTVKGIKSALASMPQKIDELYELTLERVQEQAGDDGILAMRILGWITHARRPLSVDELRYGLAVEYDNDEVNDLNPSELDEDNLLQPESLVDVCAGLVIIDSTSQVIRLVHYTTQEYFSNRRLNFFAEAEVDISRACLTYLSYDTGHRFPPLGYQAMVAFQSHPFLYYASHHWFSHANRSLSTKNLGSVFLNFVAHFKCSDSCLRSISLLRWDPQYGTNAHVHHPVPDMKCPDQESALACASYLGLEELVTVLLDHITGSYPGLDRSLFFASGSGALKVVNLLLRYGAQVNFIRDDVRAKFDLEADTALGIACKNGHLPVAKVLIENGANPDVGANPAMHAAALANKPIMVDLFLQKGVNVNARDSRKRTALHCAVFCASVDVIQALLDARCDLDLTDNNGCTALHNATRDFDRSLEAVKLLLDAHCDLNLKNNNGWTALHYATFSSSVDIVKVLLDAHCDLNLKDNNGWTALHYAACGGYVDVVKLLLDAHCDVNLKNNDGWIALHYAACRGYVDVVKLLVDNNCDLDLKDNDGWTALHSAALCHEVDAVEMLLDRGADASAKS